MIFRRLGAGASPVAVATRSEAAHSCSMEEALEISRLRSKKARQKAKEKAEALAAQRAQQLAAKLLRKKQLAEEQKKKEAEQADKIKAAKELMKNVGTIM